MNSTTVRMKGLEQTGSAIAKALTERLHGNFRVEQVAVDEWRVYHKLIEASLFCGGFAHEDLWIRLTPLGCADNCMSCSRATDRYVRSHIAEVVAMANRGQI